MTERQIDDSRYTADEQLDSALMSYIADMGRESYIDCTRGCGTTWDYRDPPVLHSVPGGNDSDRDASIELGFQIHFWRPSPDADSLALQTRCEALVADCTLGLHVVRARDFLDRNRRLPPALDTASVTGGGGVTTVGLSATDLDLDPDTIYAVILSCSSGLSETTEVWCDSNSGTIKSPVDDTGGEGVWVRTAIVGQGSGGTFWYDGSSFTASAHDDKPYLLEVVITELGYTDVQDGTATYDDKDGPIPPVGRLSRRHVLGGSGISGFSTSEVIHFWPPFSEDEQEYDAVIDDPGSTTEHWIRRTGLGYVKLYSVFIDEAVKTPAAIASALAPERPAGVSAYRATTLLATQTAEERPPVWSTYALPEYDEDDPASSALGYRMRSRVLIDLATTYATMAEAVVGAPFRYKIDGTGYAQAVYDISFLVHVVTRAQSLDLLEGDLFFRAEITEMDGSGSSGTEVVRAANAPAGGLRSPLWAKANAAFWVGRPVVSTSQRAPGRSSTGDMWCESAWKTATPVWVRMTLPDIDATGAALNRDRLLTIEARHGDGTNDEPIDWSSGAEVYCLTGPLLVTARRGLTPNTGVTT